MAMASIFLRIATILFILAPSSVATGGMKVFDEGNPYFIMR